MYTSQYSLFGKMVGIIGGACCLAALVMNSVMPLVIGCVVLFSTLSYMNGLGSRTQKA